MTWGSRSRHERGYGAEWVKLRTRILTRDGHQCRCHDCTKAGRYRVATEVDHITPKAKGGTDDPSNLQAINTDCHKRKTARETGKPLRTRPFIGLDGYPVRK